MENSPFLIKKWKNKCILFINYYKLVPDLEEIGLAIYLGLFVIEQLMIINTLDVNTCFETIEFI